MSTQFFISPFNATQSYQKYDIVYGIDLGASVAQSPYFYATQDQASAYHPSGMYTYSVTSYSRSEDKVTLTYTHTGGPAFAAGSIATVAGVTAVPSVHFTGMVNAGTTGSITYICPGYAGSGVLAAGTITAQCPAWTTGYLFIPDYTTKVPVQNRAIVTQLGNGYAQRSSNGVNTFDQNPNLVYRNIDGRQTKAILNFCEDTAGVRPFAVLFNDQYLFNQPNQKFTAQSADAEPASYGRYNVNVALTRVFDP